MPSSNEHGSSTGGGTGGRSRPSSAMLRKVVLRELARDGTRLDGELRCHRGGDRRGRLVAGLLAGDSLKVIDIRGRARALPAAAPMVQCTCGGMHPIDESKVLELLRLGRARRKAVQVDVATVVPDGWSDEHLLD